LADRLVVAETLKFAARSRIVTLCGDHDIGVLPPSPRPAPTTGKFMIRRYSGDKKSIEARSDDGRTWSVKLFDNGRLTEYSGGTLAEVDALAVKHQLKLDR
jgi:hypothetical protein